jgi:D-arabinose 1-dehydrogenase-like Zn-dependent alcohol dehydrogenase
MGDWEWLKIELPKVLGHEMSGIVEEAGPEVQNFHKGDRVIVPFSRGDGICPQCLAGHSNICDNAPEGWGGFGEYVHIPLADLNLVSLPGTVNFDDAAGMGCRFMTSFHGLIDQANLRPGEWVAINGCGGVGLSAVQIASAMGANAIAIDIDEKKLEFAKRLGAVFAINAGKVNVPQAVLEITGGGSHVSIDGLGIAATCQASILGLRKRGRHVQIGLSTNEGRGGSIPVPIDLIVSREIQIIGSNGMQVSKFSSMLGMVEKGVLKPGAMVSRTISVEEVGEVMAAMSDFAPVGVTVLNRW